MNKLSEDEAIKELKERLQALKKHTENYEESKCETNIYNQLKKEATAIETILDLYQQEKEKNKELLKDNNVLNRLVYFNKNITFPYEIELTSTNEFVSKDKIRAKIKELENELKYENFRDGNLIQINVLKKILEEN